jgi:hypothetical protein
MLRRYKKINPLDFIIGFIFCFCKTNNTYSEWAEQTGRLCGTVISKQAFCKRITAQAAAFSKALLEKTVVHKVSTSIKFSLFNQFKKVILQDSTTLQLPDCLSACFAGNRTNGVQKAIARIQALLDIKSMQFLNFTLSGFTRNDQAASADIIDYCNKGDLIIRDLGYFVTSVFEKLIKDGVYVLSRLRFGMKMYDLNGKEISLYSLLKAGTAIDRWVLIGEKKLQVRLLMLPLPAKIAAEKKRKAKNDRDKRLNHSKLYYRWLKYNVYITTAGEQIWTTGEVQEAYKVRWQIEIVFKSWKTGLSMDKMIHDRCTNEHRVSTCIYLMLLFVTLLLRNVFMPALQMSIKKEKQCAVSLIKLLKWISKSFTEIFYMPLEKLSQHVIKKCCYEKRNKRGNMILTLLNYQIKN